MIKFRPYQGELAAATLEAWKHHDNVLDVLATGGGKTVVFASLIHDHVGSAAAVVHRKEILSQIACSLAQLDTPHRVVAPPKTVKLIRRRQLKKFGKSFIDPTARVGVVSAQTLTSKSSANNESLQRWLNQVTLAVFDEGHHYVKTGTWSRAVEAVNGAKKLFVTATPERADGQGLGADANGYADVMLEGPQVAELIAAGYLSPFTYKAPESDLDFGGVPITASGDLNMRVMRERVVESHLVGDVVDQYQKYGGGEKCIVFATDVQTAHDIAARFLSVGVAAVALDGKTDATERDHALDTFEAGVTQVLVNVDLFDEGFDVPAAAVCIMARPTESLGKFLQMCGRVLRPVYAPGHDLTTDQGRRQAIAAGGKPTATIIDPVRNWERHGLPNWPRVWSLDGRERGAARSPTFLKTCVQCTQPYEAFLDVCPYCGGVQPLPERHAPEHVAGDLVELDVDAMASLFSRMAAADMPDDDFAAGLFAKRMPTLGHPAALRRHRDAKYRRTVLREVVGWWVGMQPGARSLSEKHRRFFYRFGIDIGNAFTLNSGDTDELIARIGAQFNEDMT